MTAQHSSAILHLLVFLLSSVLTSAVAIPPKGSLNSSSLLSTSSTQIANEPLSPYPGGLPRPFNIRNPSAWRNEHVRAHHNFLRRMTTHVERHPPKSLVPVVQEFKNLIEGNSRIYMHFVQMFDEIPWISPYLVDVVGKPQIRDYKQMLQVINHFVTTAPDLASSGKPITNTLMYALGTASGHAAFLNPDVSRMMKKVLNQWGNYLKTPASRHVLGKDEHGWLGEKTMEAFEQLANAPYNTSRKFEEIYACDPSAEYYGFKSWDDFFTRKFRDDIRPLADPEDDNVITNACEASPYNLERGVKLRDDFFIKGQPYSVLDMLANDPLAEQFAAGTVYQAFLTPLTYHRWHAPVSGTIRRAFVADGAYFTVPVYQGVGHRNTTDINPDAVVQSQAYLTSLSTRAIIIIEADNPAIGLIGFIAVGMDEVSSCDITVAEGQHIKKGKRWACFIMAAPVIVCSSETVLNSTNSPQR